MTSSRLQQCNDIITAAAVCHTSGWYIVAYSNVGANDIHCLSPCVGQYRQISDDLVNSHSLLLCCVDMLYNAALLTDRKELLNTESLKAGEQTTVLWGSIHCVMVAGRC